MKSDINPFDSQETKAFKDEPEILAMTQMVAAYQQNDIQRFEQILEANRATVMNDPFIREHIEELLANIRTEVILIFKYKQGCCQGLQPPPCQGREEIFFYSDQ